jgi:hypothetical protein
MELHRSHSSPILSTPSISRSLRKVELKRTSRNTNLATLLKGSASQPIIPRSRSMEVPATQATNFDCAGASSTHDSFAQVIPPIIETCPQTSPYETSTIDQVANSNMFERSDTLVPQIEDVVSEPSVSRDPSLASDLSILSPATNALPSISSVTTSTTNSATPKGRVG